MTENLKWYPIDNNTIPTNYPVWTKISDAAGERNIQMLQLYLGLWWLPDHSMYVYYTPTHWAEVQR